MQDNIEVKEVSSTEFKISITACPENVNKKFDDFFQKVRSTTQVNGFRKGSVPISHLKKMFGSKAKTVVAQTIIEEQYRKALRDHNINPIGMPRLFDDKPVKEGEVKEVGKFAEDNSYCIDLLVEVFPKIDPVGYDGMILNRPGYDLEAMRNLKLDEYRNQFAERRQVSDRGVQLGDSVVVDFDGFLNGVKFHGGSAVGHVVQRVGNNELIAGFEDQMLGMKAGEEKDICVVFPVDDRVPMLSGKDVVFKVKLQNIVSVSPASVDDNLALMVGFNNLDEFNKHIDDLVKEDVKESNRHVLNHQIMSRLLELNKFDAPPTMLKVEENRLMTGRKADQMSEQDKQRIKEAAQFNVKRALLANAIYDKESSLELSPNELNKMLEEHAKKNNQTKDELVSNLYNSKQMDNFVSVLKTMKVFDYIIEHSKEKESEEKHE